MNPILKRLVQSDTGTTTLTQLLAWFIVGSIGVLLGGVAFEWPAFYFKVLVYATCPATLIVLMLVVAVVSALTLRETSGEPFQLLYLTNIAPQQIVWGYVLGFAYRLRVYLVLLIWLASISALLISISLRSYGLALEDGDPSLWEGVLLFIFWLNGALGAAFMVVTNTVASTLRFRQPALASISSLLVVSVALCAGLLVEMLLLTLADGAAVLFWGFILATLPYAVGWGLIWLSGGSDYVDIISTALMALLGVHWVACSLGTLIAVKGSDILGIVLIAYIILGLWGAFGRVYRGRQTSRAARITILVWALILFALVWQLASEASDFVGVLLLVIVANALLTVPYVLGVGLAERSARWVWRF